MPSIEQDFLTKIRPKPHPYKFQLLKLGVSVGATAVYVDRVYPYVMNMLNGVYPMTARTERKIKELIEKVKASIG